ncbi:hypothetical protein HY991_04835 [Candidatus Micrarchaeota archaeon]|nr:hypothetical protein [Candidatus Micrarchaeota archaeon]
MAEEGLNIASMVLTAVVFIAFVWITKLIFDLKKFMKEKEELTLAKMARTEATARSIEASMGELNKAIDEKVDKEYMDKRIDELISLAGGKKK